MLNDNNARVIDVRPNDAYNGWKMNNESRGGHIKGARSLPAKWAKYIDWIEIVGSKSFSPDQSIIVYGYDEAETEHVADRFIRTGFENVSLYHDFVAEWSPARDLPMEKLVNYRHLVSAQWLNRLITTGTAPEFDNDRHIICHAHYRNRKAYEDGHIPGAVDLDTNLLESPETWNRRSPAELEKALKNKGIGHDSTVVLYGRNSFADDNDPFPGSSAGQLGAMRCAFIMLYAGVKDVRILNGGLQSWIDDGFETVTDETEENFISDFGAEIPARPEYMTDMPQAKDILKSSGSNLVCVRSWNEYIGQVSGYNYIEKKGRIPGVVFADCGSDAYHMENYRNLDHTTREYHEIERIWAGAGITSDKHNAFYCGTGWRGSEAFINAWLMGWPKISVFDGGWFEWSNDEKNPFETGLPDVSERTIDA